MTLNPELITFFSAMLPFVELKLAMPLAIKMGLSPISTFIFAVTGCIMPAAIALATVKPASNYLRKKFKYVDRFFINLFKKTQKKHKKNFSKYGALLIIMFVAIPIPGSGTVAGSMIAFVFGIDHWKALGLVSIGAMISGIIVMAGTESIFAMTSLFQH